MAHVQMPDGREFDIEDGNSALEEYYLGEGATVSKSIDSAPDLPRVFDGEKYVDGHDEGDAPQVESVEVVPAAGEDGEHHDGELVVDGGDPLDLSGDSEQH